MFCLSMYIHVQVVLSRDCFQGVVARSLEGNSDGQVFTLRGNIVSTRCLQTYRCVENCIRSLMILYTHNVQHIYIYNIYIYIHTLYIT